MKSLGDEEVRIAVIGLGYVGLPLAVAFGEQFGTVGFDRNEQRIASLRRFDDVTREVDPQEIEGADKLIFSADSADLADCNVFIVAVPTPIDADKNPDIGLLIKASEVVGHHLKPGDMVVFESTVYPGATEEDCVPVLEQVSGLRCNRDFYVGYSPERVNPGDRQHRLRDIVKVVSASTDKAADFVEALYGSIIRAGIVRASSIRVAEAAKVIENTQRDVNIALVNELAIIFNRLGIDTEEVLQVAGSKWNFLPFRPGLVGGHCIGVDPYYLTHKAQSAGIAPEVILSGRRINDNMGGYVAGQLASAMIAAGITLPGSRVLVMGLAFKEDCRDLRNTRVVDVVSALQDQQISVDVHDPWVDRIEAESEYGIQLVDELVPGTYDAIVIAVAHREFRDMSEQRIRALGKDSHVLYDIKYVLPPDAADLRL